ncbi:MAG: CDP-alcohol phosphatidyltransferase family protein [Pirellulaceae bacterium]|nr:CDP-alcohol phosphatidyltransferase family protein [Pirellulaceae bacterium]
MAKRISHSWLDPWLGPPLKSLYHVLPIPRRFPPEGIVAVGHLLAVLGAVGMAFSTNHWWGGLLVALGVMGNHTADCLDGTHARSTGQCRNGGELLDHFTDPLSFAYWLLGLAVSCGRPYWGVVAVICLYATAVLTNIKAKLIGEFTLARFGPTEFKVLLSVYGLLMAAVCMAGGSSVIAQNWATRFFAALIVIGILQLVVNLWLAVRDVNQLGAAPDESEWVTSDDCQG